jgi:hypothetical protein
MSLVVALGLAALLLPGRTTEVAQASAVPTPALNTGMVSAIAGGADGSVALVGRFRDAVTIGDRTIRSAGGRDGIVIVRDAEGDLRWVRRIGSPDDDEASVVAFGPDGMLYVGGVVRARPRIGAEPIADPWTQENLWQDVRYVAAFSTDGSLRWFRHWPGDFTAVAGLAADATGRVWVAEQCFYRREALGLTLTRLDDTGASLARPAGARASDCTGGGNGVSLSRMRIDDAGRLLVVGQMRDTLDWRSVGIGTSTASRGATLTARGRAEDESFGWVTDGFLARVTTDGRLDWAIRMGRPRATSGDTDPSRDASGEGLSAVAIGPDGMIYVSGDVYGTMRRPHPAWTLVSSDGVVRGDWRSGHSAETVETTIGLFADGDTLVQRDVSPGKTAFLRIRPDGTRRWARPLYGLGAASSVREIVIAPGDRVLALVEVSRSAGLRVADRILRAAPRSYQAVVTIDPDGRVVRIDRNQ